MKGMVFTEFLEMVEDKFSADMVDDIIDDSAPPSGGAYTGSRHVRPQRACRHGGRALAALGACQYRRWCMPLVCTCSDAFMRCTPHSSAALLSAVDFLYGIESVIHTEVRKLYPDAQLPSFDCERLPNGLNMLYASPVISATWQKA